ncbi:MULTISPECIES: hypothetical protein [Pseudomonas syringae group]|uniref:hypothetical protein n=1 Tax=Pseudomonas syringae group TaxID=136849 RepID=UPI000760B248|nr:MULTISPECIES: hypothetical protein [Pseudomonas syringae group]KWS85874.1 hypothetical protein AL049_04465 [Pseudomonas syringae pv. cerasicola]RMS66202.1 hypothetical protein ALP61_03317 [Pseudomonas savastanoi]RMT53567.1 hypothetical protein ALP47_100894 [Pseudomonas savastanoi]SOS17456.1 putative secreted protein [Pseudomonas syringae pv. cerasicola]SPF15167.1 putative secreted protein [Pseudomonas syringae pv. cerasicola]
MKNKLLVLCKSRRAQFAAASIVMATASPSFAAGAQIDTAEALGYVAGGVAAAAAVVAAMFGLVALIGAAKKAMRAGT